MERMINERLVWLAEKYEWLDKTQNFRRGRSCIDNIARITVDIEINLKEEKKVERKKIGAFLDVKSAYDNVIKSIIVRQIEKRCPKKIVGYIQE